MTTDSIFYSVVTLVIFIIAFLLLRRFFLWYWGITKLTHLQEKQTSYLSDISSKLSILIPEEVTKEKIELVKNMENEKPFVLEAWECSKCSVTNKINPSICEKCGTIRENY